VNNLIKQLVKHVRRLPTAGQNRIKRKAGYKCPLCSTHLTSCASLGRHFSRRHTSLNVLSKAVKCSCGKGWDCRIGSEQEFKSAFQALGRHLSRIKNPELHATLGAISGIGQTGGQL